MNIFKGNLFVINILRIPENQNFNIPLSAVTQSVEGDPFCVGIIHTTNERGTYYIAMSGEGIIADGNDLDDVAERVLQKAQVELSLSAAEMEQLLFVLTVQDDAEYCINKKRWKFKLGSDEVALSDIFKGALIVNVTPFYNTEIKAIAPCGEADDDALEDDDEFCGALRAG
jgi:hypothetical protein